MRCGGEHTQRADMRSPRRGKPVYEPPRYMTAQQAAEQLIEVEATRGQGSACPRTRMLYSPE
jgi:diphthamide biosynthesis methyltransferase